MIDCLVMTMWNERGEIAKGKMIEKGVGYERDDANLKIA